MRCSPFLSLSSISRKVEFALRNIPEVSNSRLYPLHRDLQRHLPSCLNAVFGRCCTLAGLQGPGVAFTNAHSITVGIADSPTCDVCATDRIEPHTSCAAVPDSQRRRSAYFASSFGLCTPLPIFCSFLLLVFPLSPLQTLFPPHAQGNQTETSPAKLPACTALFFRPYSLLPNGYHYKN